MPFIPVPNTATFELIFAVFGQKCENVYGVQRATPWDVESLTATAARFKAWYASNGQALTHSGCALVKIVGKSLESKTAPAIEYSAGMPLAGTFTGGEALPLNVTVAVSFGTALRGRSYRGRIYQIGLTTLGATDNQVSLGYLNTLNQAYNNYIDVITAEDELPVVISRYTNNSARTVGVATPIISVTINGDLDSQRRRLTGRGQ